MALIVFSKATSIRSVRAILQIIVGSILVVAVVPAFSQSDTGRILGTVSDQTGAAVDGAIIIVVDTERGAPRTASTDQSGDYVVPALPPGRYKVAATAKGFKTIERVDIELQVGKDARLDFSLPPGQASETVTVQEEVPLIETTNDTLGGTLTNRQINDLPLNGRNYENLLTLRPGITRYPGGGFDTTSTNGLRPEQNLYILDGLVDFSPFSGQSVINGAGIAGDSATILPIDAIQEFNVEENPPAEFGWKPGGVVNVALKAGTNGLHGTAYGFGRDTALDARNYFNPVTQPKTPLSLEQYGGTIGGPIVKEKIFFFGGYEGQRYSVGNSYGAIAVPVLRSLPSQGNCTFLTSGDCQNSIADATADLAAGGVTLNSLSQTLLALYPSNNGPSPLVNIGFPNTVHANNLIAKVDYHVSDRHVLNGRYFFGDNAGTIEDQSVLRPAWLTLIHTRAQVVQGNWLWTPSSRWANEFRTGYTRLYQPTYNADHNVNPTTYGINTGVTNPIVFGMPQISVSGFNYLGGTANRPKVQGPDETLQFLDHVSYTRGNHAIKFGGEVRRNFTTAYTYLSGKGVIKFNANTAFPGATPLEDFLAGAPKNGKILSGDPQRSVSMWSIAGFFQDDWRVTPRLTANLGVRYELNTVIKESHDLLGNFDPAVGLVQVGKQISAPYNGDHNNFAPRVGLAWDPTGTGKTVIRAGGGVTYEQMDFNIFLSQQGTSNASTLGLNTIPTGGIGVQPGGGSIAVGPITFKGANLDWTSAGPVFPTGTIDCSANPCSIMAVDRNLRNPYVTSWNVNVQHTFTRDLSLEVGYVGNHGTKLTGLRDINQVNQALDDGGEQIGRPYNVQFPFLAFINQLSNGYHSNYNSLQTTLTQRPVHGVSFIVGYTYGHALDDVSQSALGNVPQNSLNPGAEYASSDYDIRHRLTIATTYQIPGKKSWGQVLQGWQINSIVTLQSAQPWNVSDQGDDISLTGEFNDRWNFSGNPSDFKSGPTAIPYYVADSNPACVGQATTPALLASLQQFGCYAKGRSVVTPPAVGTFGTMGRNIFRDSGFRNWDLSVVKNWRFKERFEAQFRAEFFNALNHPNFANPWGAANQYAQTDPSATSTFGCGCSTPDVAATNPVIGSGGPRAIQLGAKFTF
jgi:hypothetical protein